MAHPPASAIRRGGGGRAKAWRCQLGAPIARTAAQRAHRFVGVQQCAMGMPQHQLLALPSGSSGTRFLPALPSRNGRFRSSTTQAVVEHRFASCDSCSCSAVEQSFPCIDVCLDEALPQAKADPEVQALRASPQTHLDLDAPFAVSAKASFLLTPS